LSRDGDQPIDDAGTSGNSSASTSAARSPRPGVPVIDDHDETVRAVALSPDGTLVATAGDDASVRIWDVATGNRSQRMPRPAAIRSLAFSPDGAYLAVGGADGSLTLWDTATWESKATLAEIGSAAVVRIAFAPDGHALATVGYNQDSAQVWNLETNELAGTLSGHSGDVNDVAFDRQGLLLATVGDDRSVRLWDAGTFSAGPVLTRHDRPVLCAAFSPGGGALATGGEDRTIVIWDLATNTPQKPELLHDAAVVFVAWTPEGRIVSKTFRDEVRLWTPADASFERIREPFEEPLVGVGKSYHADVALTRDAAVLAFRDCYWGRSVHLVELDR
jgi:WD40 repeat protein